MFAVPPRTPVAIPLTAPTEALDGALLIHVPPVVPTLASGVVVPWQKASVPEMAVGKANIVTTVLLPQPEVPRKVMLVVPAERPVTTPDVAPIVATDGLLLVHETPGAG